MKALYQALRRRPVVYVTRDIERALGLPIGAEGYFIISNATEFAKETSEGRDNALLISGEKLLDTHELLAHGETKNFIALLKNPGLLVFKNTPLIERISAASGWRLLNPSAALAARVEEKISQVEWLGQLAAFLPPRQITVGRKVAWNGQPFILQFNRAHTGLGTELIESESGLQAVRRKFPGRPVRLTAFIDGPMFTSNSIVTSDRVLAGNVSYQITGLPPFTDNKFATIGNDWGLGAKFLAKTEFNKQYTKISNAVGEKLLRSGWRGLFGLDFALDEQTQKLYLIEINARQPASAAYESRLQENSSAGAEVCATFESHLASLVNVNLANAVLTPLTTGAQIILRNQAGRELTDKDMKKVADQLESLGFGVIQYPNTAPGSDRLRIQSQTAIMSSPNHFNGSGQAIVDIVNKIL